jgi:hypothetical protein
MGAEYSSQNGKRKVRDLGGPDGATRLYSYDIRGCLLRNMAKPRLAPEERVLRAWIYKERARTWGTGLSLCDHGPLHRTIC